MQSDFTLNLSLSVTDREALWRAAATALSAMAPSLSEEDIADTLGPREAPNVCDCLTTLLLPSSVPGCAIQQFSCTRTADPDSIDRGYGKSAHDMGGLNRAISAMARPVPHMIRI